MDSMPGAPGTTGGAATGGVPRARPARRRSRSTVALVYGGLLLAAVVAFASHEWGADVHSWIGLAVIGVVTWHVVSQRRWVTSAARRGLAHPERVLVVYNVVLAVVFVVVNVSGFPVWFGGAGGAVLAVHNATGIAFVLLVLGHLALNRHRLVARLRRRRRAAAGVSA